jgi:hypothetical protein
VPDNDDPAIEEEWCQQRRDQVEDYLRRENVAHGRVGEWPAWHVAPYVSVWAVESTSRPDWIGWWVICGDVPTDYVSAANIKHPRDAVRAFGERWRELARVMADGDQAPDVRIGGPEEAVSLAGPLKSRASMLLQWADDNELWDGVDRASG